MKNIGEKSTRSQGSGLSHSGDEQASRADMASEPPPHDAHHLEPGSPSLSFTSLQGQGPALVVSFTAVSVMALHGVQTPSETWGLLLPFTSLEVYSFSQ